MKNDAPWLKRD